MVTTVTTVKGSLPHIEWVDLNNDGTLVEVAVFKRDDFGNLYFIRVDNLDNVDKSRLVKVVQNRNANMYELWDLMSNLTLGNGINALDYFHQLVQVLTPAGKIMKPKLGQVGIRLVDETISSAPTIDDLAPKATKKKSTYKKKAAASDESETTEE